MNVNIKQLIVSFFLSFYEFKYNCLVQREKDSGEIKLKEVLSEDAELKSKLSDS